MCGYVFDILDVDKLSPEQHKALGKFLRARKKETSHQLEEVTIALKRYNKSRSIKKGQQLRIVKSA